jgi:hypothetical protein
VLQVKTEERTREKKGPHIFFFFFFLPSSVFAMLLLWVLFCVGFCASAQSRAKALLQRMTLQEKISMLHGSKGPYVGQTAPNSRLGIPSLQMEDGPQGVADGVKNVTFVFVFSSLLKKTVKATAWPSALTIAQSWDLNLFGEFAGAMGRQQRAKGTGVLLGPMMNLARVAEGGERCFKKMEVFVFFLGIVFFFFFKKARLWEFLLNGDDGLRRKRLVEAVFLFWILLVLKKSSSF